MPQQQDIKETKELLKAMLTITVLLAKQFKDGVQVADFASIMANIVANPELKAKIEAAYVDIEKVKAEIGDISLVEGLELLKEISPEFIELVAVIKAPKA